MNTYVIVNTKARDPDTGDRLYWNDTMGWVDLKRATKFRARALGRLNLPVDGQWVSLGEARTRT